MRLTAEDGESLSQYMSLFYQYESWFVGHFNQTPVTPLTAQEKRRLLRCLYFQTLSIYEALVSAESVFVTFSTLFHLLQLLSYELESRIICFAEMHHRLTSKTGMYNQSQWVDMQIKFRSSTLRYRNHLEQLVGIASQSELTLKTRLLMIEMTQHLSREEGSSNASNPTALFASPSAAGDPQGLPADALLPSLHF